ncbi:hypothetical protein SBA4_1570006 [Candidatus Sulfopaludibacter sp. SbA4]|nr:hypothetical protein SBA4_1570006 [Candidatus Sulfopaludibacter sp. SbA4]
MRLPINRPRSQACRPSGPKRAPREQPHALSSGKIDGAAMIARIEPGRRKHEVQPPTAALDGSGSHPNVPEANASGDCGSSGPSPILPTPEKAPESAPSKNTITDEPDLFFRTLSLILKLLTGTLAPSAGQTCHICLLDLNQEGKCVRQRN